MGAKKMTENELLTRMDEIRKEVGATGGDELFKMVWRQIQVCDKKEPGKHIDEGEMRRFAEAYAEQAMKKLIKTEGFMEAFRK